MKKIWLTALTLAIFTGVLTGCAKSSDNRTIVIGASPAPHAEILKVAGEVLQESGYTLRIKEYSEYIQPNAALAEGALDANYFQHHPYLSDYNNANGTDLVSAAVVHYEHFGIYAGRTVSLETLEDGAIIAVPNDSTNEARALLLLEAQGLIKLKDGAGLNATKKDIAENKRNFDIVEIEAAQIPRCLPDVDIGVINGNCAMDAGLAVSEALATEDAEAVGIQNYGNIIAVRTEDKNSEAIQALVLALKSDKVQAYIEETYNGAVIGVP